MGVFTAHAVRRQGTRKKKIIFFVHKKNFIGMVPFNSVSHRLLNILCIASVPSIQGEKRKKVEGQSMHKREVASTRHLEMGEKFEWWL
jgi:hypothetical protein